MCLELSFSDMETIQLSDNTILYRLTSNFHHNKEKGGIASPMIEVVT